MTQATELSGNSIPFENRPFFDSSRTGLSIMKAASVEEAIALIPAGASIMIGEFMSVGTPQRLLDEIVRQQKAGLASAPTGSQLRGHATIVEAEELPPDDLRVNYLSHDRDQRRERPACVADLIGPNYR